MDIMREGIRHAALHVIPGGRHSILTENLREVGTVMRDFLTPYCAQPRLRQTPRENS
ncbi:hydrolase [Pandoraea apista]|uniref:Hydrolase n=1 Tax=Pandoraea apista TaxID=93218 RepID=A0A5E5P3J9_9BURK|nr:hypothetical protein LMG16407_00578 [Pandoraea apista]VVG71191.1 hydrolase [Pandoraea apista]